MTSSIVTLTASTWVAKTSNPRLPNPCTDPEILEITPLISDITLLSLVKTGHLGGLVRLDPKVWFKKVINWQTEARKIRETTSKGSRETTSRIPGKRLPGKWLYQFPEMTSLRYIYLGNWGHRAYFSSPLLPLIYSAIALLFIKECVDLVLRVQGDKSTRGHIFCWHQIESCVLV